MRPREMWQNGCIALLGFLQRQTYEEFVKIFLEAYYLVSYYLLSPLLQKYAACQGKELEKSMY